MPAGVRRAAVRCVIHDRHHGASLAAEPLLGSNRSVGSRRSPVAHRSDTTFTGLEGCYERTRVVSVMRSQTVCPAECPRCPRVLPGTPTLPWASAM